MQSVKYFLYAGTVVSESLNYTKMLTFGHDGYLVWQLAPGSKSYTDLTIFNRMKIKRMEPYN
jgi:glycerol kinase